jgi:hypothetical protein
MILSIVQNRFDFLTLHCLTGLKNSKKTQIAQKMQESPDSLIITSIHWLGDEGCFQSSYRIE